MTFSICVATYKRPELLKLLLESLVKQELTDEIKLEIIVVDNDPAESGKPVLGQYADTQKISFYYYTQPINNISLARNKAVKSATGEYIFFIDDDEIASSSWVKLMVETMANYKADAVFGRVLSYYGESTPDWIKKSYLFNRPSPPTGTPVFYTRTGNCLIKASILIQIEGPFDPAYGVTGGEDTHLFGKLRRNGNKFVNCYEAWVSEFQPPARTKTSYLIKRAFFTGNLSTRRTIEFSGKYRFLTRIKFLTTSTMFLILSFLLMIICFPNRHYRIYWATKIASNFGHFLAVFNVKIKIFK